MTDHELLELAAGAAGIKLQWNNDPSRDPRLIGATAHERPWWNPLTDDGDALRLAVKLRLRVEINQESIVVYWIQDFESKSLYEYPETIQDKNYYILHVSHDKATRRAIVRAAAALAKSQDTPAGGDES